MLKAFRKSGSWVLVIMIIASSAQIIAGRNSAGAAVENLYGTAQTSTYTITNPSASIDSLFNDSYANNQSGQWSKGGSWTFTSIGDTALTPASVSAEVRFYQGGGWTDDQLLVDVYDGSAWTTVGTYDSGTPPPSSISTEAFDVSSILDTTTKINNAQIMVYGGSASGSKDSYSVYADGVRLVVTSGGSPATVKQAHYRIGDDDAANPTWFAAADTTATNIVRGNNIRVRFQVYNDGGAAASFTPQLEWSATSGSGYAAVATSSSGDPFFVNDTTYYTNGSTISTANFGLGTGTGTAEDGIAYDTANPAGGAVTLNNGYYQEIEFNIQSNTNASYSTSYYFRLTDSGSTLDAYDVTEAVLTMESAPPATTKQAHYRIGDDTDLASMSWLAAIDTTATNIVRGNNIRVRFQVYNDGGLAASFTPQIEWSATSGSGYAAVSTSSGGDPFFVNDTTFYTNGATISTANFGLGAGTGTAENGIAYDTANPAGGAVTLNNGYYQEIEFSVQSNSNASYSTSYYFRLTDSGSALDAYDVTEAVLTMQSVPSPATVKQAHFRIGDDDGANPTWLALVDTTATNIIRGNNIRVRFQVYNDGGTNGSFTPQLEWSATSGSGYAAVATSSGGNPFFVNGTTYYTNGTTISTGNFGLGTGTGSAENGIAYDTANPAGSAVTTNAFKYQEIEFSIQSNSNASYSTSYYFRLTDSGSTLDAYDVTEAVLTMQSAPSPATVKQAHYRIGDDDGADPTWLALVDTTATNILRGNNIRVRFQVYNDGGTNGSFTPQLEWSATSGSGYATVATSSGGDPFFVNNTTYYTNGITISTGNFGLGVGTGSAEDGIAYDTANPAGSAVTTNAFKYQEIEFSIQSNSNASYSTSYYFRLTDSGSALDAYDVTEAALTIQSAPGAGVVKQAHYRIGRNSDLTLMSWLGGTDTTAPDIVIGSNIRVRFQVYTDNGSPASFTPQLEWSATSGSGYAAVATSSGGDPFYVYDTTKYTNGATISTANFALGTGTGSAENGIAYDSANPAGSTVSMSANTYQEIEFSIRSNINAAYSTSYYFRLTDSGSALDAYDVTEAVFTTQTQPDPSDPHNLLGYSSTADGCAGCHRLHTGGGPGLKAGASEEGACYNCHDGVLAADVYSQFASTSVHTIADQTWVHVTGETDSTDFNNRHVECEDCHIPHSSYPGTHALGTNTISLSLYGASGLSVTNGAAGTTPTFTFVDDASYEYEVCMKCHTSWSDATSQSYPSQPSLFLTDVSVEFNPANLAHHAVEGPGANQSANANYLQTYVSPWGPDSVLYCSDCHGDSNTSGPAGSHGSDNLSLLAGSADDSTIVCFKCHRFDVYGGSSPVNASLSRVEHPLSSSHTDPADNVYGIYCLNCHGGATPGGIHGTNAGIGPDGGTAALGEHFLNGAAMTGFTPGTGGVSKSLTCWTKSSADSVNSCTRGHGGTGTTPNYDY